MAGRGRRLLALWAVHGRLDVVLMARSPRLAVTWVLTDLLSYGVGIASMLLLAQTFDGVGPWTMTQFAFMLAYATAVAGVRDTMFSYNVSFISRQVGRGQLDHVLVQPQPMWMSLLTSGFAPVVGGGLLLPGLALMAFSAVRLPIDATPGWVALVAVNLLSSVAIVVAVAYAWGALAFWAPRGAEEISTSAHGLMSRRTFPLDGTGPVVRGVLSSVFPVALGAWFPARALVGLDTRPFAVLVTPAAALVLGAVAAVVFRQGVKHYGHTGSQRYSGWGHRS